MMPPLPPLNATPGELQRWQRQVGFALGMIVGCCSTSALFIVLAMLGVFCDA